MIVQELVAVLGTKIEEGEFADVFALLNNLEDVFSKVFGAITDGINEAFKTVHEVASMGDEIGATAEKFGIAADALQELGYAANLSDTSAEAVTSSLKFLSKAAVDAANGSAEAVKAFKGVTLKDATGQIRPVADLLTDLSDQFAALPNGAAKTDRALQLFGKSGADLIPLLNRGSAGIAALREEARAAGVVLSGQALEASAAYDDAVKRLEGSLQGLKNAFAIRDISKVTALFEKLRAVLSGKGIARVVEALSVGFGRLVDTFGVLIDAFGWLVSNETVVEGALFVITAALTGLGLAAVTAGSSLVGAAISAAAAWVAAALPFVALGALIALVVDDIYTFIEGGDSMLGRIIGWFSSIDPEDNEFVKLLKAAGALLFDLTDTNKWKKLGQAIFDWVMSPVKAIVDSLKWVLDKLGGKALTDKFDFKVNTNLSEVAPGLSDPLQLQGRSFGDAMNEKFPGAAPLISGIGNGLDTAGNFLASMLPSNMNVTGDEVAKFWLPGGAASPAASASLASSVSNNRSSTSINAPITITVPPGTDAAGVAEAARQAVRDELGGHLQDAHAANGGN